MIVAWLALFACAAWAQDPMGGVSGVVVDAITRIPVKKVLVTVQPMANPGMRVQGGGATTDASGAFTINGLSVGKIRLMFQTQNYPQARFGGVARTIEIKAGETAGPVTVELMPGATVSGHIVDEDGDPMLGCNVQVHPTANPSQGVQMTGNSSSNQDGEWRAYGIAAGKYLLSAQCGQQVFQARPLSAGPDPPPSRAYPTLYYPAAIDAKTAQVVELVAGAEKSGIDFQMTPVGVTQVYGAFAPGSAEKPGDNIVMQLIAGRQRGSNIGAIPHQDKGTFEFHQVFPGSYTLVVFSGNDDKRVGAWQRVEVGDRPVQVVVELRHSMDLSGRLEIESGNNTNKITPSQIQVMISSPSQMGMPGTQAPTNEDGTFTLKGVLPGPWLIRANGPAVFLKAAWLGGTDVTSVPMDLSSGAGGTLRIVVSTNTATIRGSAPVGQTVMAQSGEEPMRTNRATTADQNGQYMFVGLAPGKYRLLVTDPGNPPPDEGGQEVTVAEGETAMVDLKAP